MPSPCANRAPDPQRARMTVRRACSGAASLADPEVARDGVDVHRDHARDLVLLETAEAVKLDRARLAFVDLGERVERSASSGVWPPRAERTPRRRGPWRAACAPAARGGSATRPACGARRRSLSASSALRSPDRQWRNIIVTVRGSSPIPCMGTATPQLVKHHECRDSGREREFGYSGTSTVISSSSANAMARVIADNRSADSVVTSRPRRARGTVMM